MESMSNNIKFDEEWLKKTEQIEIEANCDIEAGGVESFYREGAMNRLREFLLFKAKERK
jgi:hypothetical protein